MAAEPVRKQTNLCFWQIELPSQLRALPAHHVLTAVELHLQPVELLRREGGACAFGPVQIQALRKDDLPYGAFSICSKQQETSEKALPWLHLLFLFSQPKTNQEHRELSFKYKILRSIFHQSIIYNAGNLICFSIFKGKYIIDILGFILSVKNLFSTKA